MQEQTEDSFLLLVRNVRIWTGDTSNPHGDAMLVRGQRVVAVGSERDVRSGRPTPDRILDGGGASLLPGFVDAHVHLVDGGLRLATLDLSGVRTPEGLRTAVDAHVRSRPAHAWVVGHGWDHQRWGGRLPHRDWIDEPSGPRPVLLTRSDLHMAVANTRALAAAGIDAFTPDPDGGRIHRDETGVATGVLVDRAIEMVSTKIPDPGPVELRAGLDRAQAHALSFGVTQVHDMGDIPPSRRDLDLLEAAHAEGRLRLRVHVATALAEWKRMQERVDERGRGDEWLWWGGLKGFVDGSLGAGTAWFSDPYLDRAGHGLTVVDLAELSNDIRGADRSGLQPIVHAIGDAAVDWLTAVYAGLPDMNGKLPRRPRMEHAQHLPVGIEHRLARAGVIASMQPAHLLDDAPWMESRLGPHRAARAYAFRTLGEAGVALAFGSDWTVVSLDPLRGIDAAVNRRPARASNCWHPEERISMDAALVGYTGAAAHAAFAEGFSGTLRPGAMADFVLLDGDVFADRGAAIGDRFVTRTFVAGTELYTREGW